MSGSWGHTVKLVHARTASLSVSSVPTKRQSLAWSPVLGPALQKYLCPLNRYRSAEIGQLGQQEFERLEVVYGIT